MASSRRTPRAPKKRPARRELPDLIGSGDSRDAVRDPATRDMLVKHIRFSWDHFARRNDEVAAKQRLQAALDEYRRCLGAGELAMPVNSSAFWEAVKAGASTDSIPTLREWFDEVSSVLRTRGPTGLSGPLGTRSDFDAWAERFATDDIIAEAVEPSLDRKLACDRIRARRLARKKPTKTSRRRRER